MLESVMHNVHNNVVNYHVCLAKFETNGPYLRAMLSIDLQDYDGSWR